MVVIAGALTFADMDRYPDAARGRAEYPMAVQSTAMATQNLLLAAHAEGLGACRMCGPLFCSNTVRDAPRLPPDWEPQGTAYARLSGAAWKAQAAARLRCLSPAGKHLGTFTSRRAAGTERGRGRLLRQNRRRINNMPILFYLPFIIVSGIFSIAAESMSYGARERETPEHED